MDTKILHFKVKKDYANHLLELLVKDDAIETINEETGFELTQEQKNELDYELVIRSNNPNHYKKWDEVKEKLQHKL